MTSATLTTTSPAHSPGSVVLGFVREVRRTGLGVVVGALALLVASWPLVLARAVSDGGAMSTAAAVAVGGTLGAYVDRRAHTRTGSAVLVLADRLAEVNGARERFLRVYARAVHWLAVRILLGRLAIRRLFARFAAGVAPASHRGRAVVFTMAAPAHTRRPRPLLAGSLDTLAPPRTVERGSGGHHYRHAPRVPICTGARPPT